jgi:hypothetical protein
MAQIRAHYRERIEAAKELEDDELAIALEAQQEKAEDLAKSNNAIERIKAEEDIAIRRIGLARKAYRFEADMEKDILTIRLDSAERIRKELEKQYETAPTEDLLAKLELIDVEIDSIVAHLNEIPQKKFQEVLNGLNSITNELSKIDGTIGEIFSEVGAQLGNITTAFSESASKTDRISAGISGIVSLINMAVSASAKRKDAEREFYQNALAFAHEYALALNEQLRIQSELSGGGFVKDYSGAIKDGFAAANDAMSNYQKALSELSKGKAKTDLRNAVDWGNVGKGAAAGAGAGAAIGSMIVPGIGTAIGAVAGVIVGGLTGLFGGKKKRDVLGGLLDVLRE